VREIAQREAQSCQLAIPINAGLDKIVEQTSTDPKTVVNDHFQALNTHRWDVVREVVHPEGQPGRMGMQAPAQYIARLSGALRDGLNEGESPANPTEGFRIAYNAILTAFPDMHIKVLEQVVVDDLVISHITWTGTHEGEFVGLAPTHRKIAFDEVLFMTVSDGLVKQTWALAEELTLLEQLGVLPGNEPR
jgi:predicted ester cyclase